MKAYAKIIDNVVVERVFGVDKSNEENWLELPDDFVYSRETIYYENGEFYIKNDIPPEYNPMEERLLKQISECRAESEMLMIALADLDLQRETDKTEAELAIAELAETVLGGM